MPETLWGKISFGVLVLYIFQAILFVVMIFVHAFGGIVQFLQLTPYTATLGVVFGVIGVIKEKNTGRIIPITTLVISFMFISLFFFILFGYQFGG